MIVLPKNWHHFEQEFDEKPQSCQLFCDFSLNSFINGLEFSL